MKSVEKQSTTRLRVLLGAVTLLLLVLAVYKVYEYRTRPPDTSVSSVPFVSPPPDLRGSLTMAKSICEGQAMIARKAARSKSIPAAEEEIGERLYQEMREAMDGCIDALDTGAARQFSQESDVPRIDAELSAAAAKFAAFMDWNARMGLPRFFDGSPLNEARPGLNEWIQQVKNVEGIRTPAELGFAGARLATWNSLGD